MTSHNLRVGDLVRLRSGSGLLTVISVGTTEVEVCYWDEETGLQSWELPHEALTKQNGDATLRVIPTRE